MARLNQIIRIAVETISLTTGGLTAPDATPTVVLRRNGSVIASPTNLAVTGIATGTYYVTYTPIAGDGFALGDAIDLEIYWEMSTVPQQFTASGNIENTPTVSEFEARTLAAADYFDASTDPVQVDGTVQTLDALLTALATAHGAGSWLSADLSNMFGDDDVAALVTSITTAIESGDLNVSDVVSALLASSLVADVVAAIKADATLAQMIGRIDANVSSLATATSMLDVKDRVSYALAVLCGAISNPQTATETFVITLSSTTYTVTGAGITSSGGRSAPTLSKA